MKANWRTYHFLLPILIIPICLLLSLGNGWAMYSTVTERPGLNGGMYSYYHLTRIQYSTYTGCVALCSLYFILSITFHLIKKAPLLLTKQFWDFLVFIGLFTICEIFLAMRFTGK
jgi:hypothetical protein